MRTNKIMKAQYIQIIITIILVLGVGFLKWFSLDSRNYINLLLLCWINNIAFFIQFLLHKKIFGNYVNPVSFFTIFLFLFSSGQLILYSLGINMEGFNIFLRLDYKTIVDSILYIILGFSFYQLGITSFVQRENIYITYDNKNESSNSKIILSTGWLFFSLGVIPYLYYLFHTFLTVSNYGYSAYYQQEGMRLNSVILGLGYYLFTGLVLIVVGGGIKHRYFAIISLILIATIKLASGDRGDGIVFLLTSYLLYVFFLKKRKVKVLQLGIVFTLLMILVPTIGTLRKNEAESFFSILMENNIVTSTLQNLGGTIWPLGKVIEILPNYENFIFGGSYAVSLLLLIPNFLRFGVLADIATNNLYASPANWLMNYLSMTYGPGFTPFAESYMNFGWFGVLAMSLYGGVISKLLSMKSKKNDNIPLMLGLSILAFLFFAMGARGSFNYIISFYIRYIMIPFFIIKIIQFRHRKKISKNDIIIYRKKNLKRNA